MGALYDAMSGAGYDGSESGGIGSAGIAPTDPNGGGYFSGMAQTVAAIGTGALAKWVDLELYQKAQGMQPQPQLGTTQNGLFIRQAGLPVSGGVNAVAQPRGGATLLNLDALLPFVLVGAAVFYFARKG